MLSHYKTVHKILLFFFVIGLFVSSASSVSGARYLSDLEMGGADSFASHQFVSYYPYVYPATNAEYHYADELIDLRKNIARPDMHQYGDFIELVARNPYDKYGLSEFSNPNDVLDTFYCIEKEAYNAIADKNKFDGLKPIDLGNLDYDVVDNDFLKRVSLTFYNEIANADRGDGIDPIAAADFDPADFPCAKLSEYNEQVAGLNDFDGVEVVDFTDMDHLEFLGKNELGRYRAEFFSPGDFDEFDLFNPLGVGRYRNSVLIDRPGELYRNVDGVTNEYVPVYSDSGFRRPLRVYG